MNYIGYFFLASIFSLQSMERLKHKLCHKSPCFDGIQALHEGDAKKLKKHLSKKTINDPGHWGKTYGDYLFEANLEHTIFLECAQTLLDTSLDPRASGAREDSFLEKCVKAKDIKLLSLILHHTQHQTEREHHNFNTYIHHTLPFEIKRLTPDFFDDATQLIERFYEMPAGSVKSIALKRVEREISIKNLSHHKTIKRPPSPFPRRGATYALTRKRYVDPATSDIIMISPPE